MKLLSFLTAGSRAAVLWAVLMGTIGGIATSGLSNREWYRQHLSAIFSDFHLFPDLRGLGGGRLDQGVQRYLSRLRLDHKVSLQGGVLSTTSLSQGQRKRLALLAAYVEDRPIYVFDEWAADQDPTFKAVFYTELLPELKAKGKGVVVITRDERYFDLADVVLKIEEGATEQARGGG